jgi:biopolymer transport protein ExbD
MSEKRRSEAPPETPGSDWFSYYSGDGVLTRYRPPCRIHTVFVAVVPWLNVMVLAAGFALFYGGMAEVPGILVDLPEQKATGGMRSSLVVVAKDMPQEAAAPADASVDEQESDDGATMRTMRLVVFFKHKEYDLSQPHHLATFRNDVASAISREGETEVLLYLDKGTTHENTMRITDMLREAGTTRVCYVVKTP